MRLRQEILEHVVHHGLDSGCGGARRADVEGGSGAYSANNCTISIGLIALHGDDAQVPIQARAYAVTSTAHASVSSGRTANARSPCGP